MPGRIARYNDRTWQPLSREGGGGRQFVAGLAILGLYLQLAAGAFCTAGLPSSANLGGFPICHTASGDQGSVPKPDRAPQQQQQSCAFCALHCHLAVICRRRFPLSRSSPVRGRRSSREQRRSRVSISPSRHSRAALLTSARRRRRLAPVGIFQAGLPFPARCRIAAVKGLKAPARSSPLRILQ